MTSMYNESMLMQHELCRGSLACSTPPRPPRATLEHAIEVNSPTRKVTIPRGPRSRRTVHKENWVMRDGENADEQWHDDKEK